MTCNTRCIFRPAWDSNRVEMHDTSRQLDVHFVRTFAGHNRPVSHVCFLPCSSLLVTGAASEPFFVWNLNAKTHRKCRSFPDTELLCALVALPAPNLQDHFVSASRDGRIHLWDATSRVCKRTMAMNVRRGSRFVVVALPLRTTRSSASFFSTPSYSSSSASSSVASSRLSKTSHAATQELSAISTVPTSPAANLPDGFDCMSAMTEPNLFPPFSSSLSTTSFVSFSHSSSVSSSSPPACSTSSNAHFGSYGESSACCVFAVSLFSDSTTSTCDWAVFDVMTGNQLATGQKLKVPGSRTAIQVAVLDYDRVAFSCLSLVRIFRISTATVIKELDFNVNIVAPDCHIRSMVALHGTSIRPELASVASAPPTARATSAFTPVIPTDAYLVLGGSDGTIIVVSYSNQGWACRSAHRQAHISSVEKLLVSPSHECVVSVGTNNELKFWYSNYWVGGKSLELPATRAKRTLKKILLGMYDDQLLE